MAEALEISIFGDSIKVGQPHLELSSLLTLLIFASIARMTPFFTSPLTFGKP